MTDEQRNDNQSLFDKLITILSGLPWPTVVREAWQIIRNWSLANFDETPIRTQINADLRRKDRKNQR